MKNRRKIIKDQLKKENGLVIVEAAIVFPVMFFVLLFIIFIGNMYYEQAKVDNVVLKYAIAGAEYVADPQLYYMDQGEPVPREVDDLDIEPYRYVLGSITEGSISRMETQITNDIKEEINDGSLLFFDNQRVNILGSDNGSKFGKFKNYIVYSTFVVQVNYEIKFPIRFLGDTAPTIAKLSSRAEVSVNDTPEFIRNVDMACDILDGSTTAKNIHAFFEKINNFIEKFS